MDQVNKWKAEDSDLSFNAFYGNNFRDAGASAEISASCMRFKRLVTVLVVLVW
ncbi:hypothetical protein PC116_g23618 [Phytophthora cactorum]|nr:hypothetical protein PC114_g21573 [Phytophthora cactorum]KAG2991438.1 hypothetical protein PC119_g18899 [Phytophthora cactorum]KAG3177284.1 hypothetical protein PC128_g16892 [Phytophthora cactorum]KAG4228016.1 hypothetical protein PC116_g23618 [Phytophthora cactorum]